jgi:threonine/homoserine/homoserine lactone efflux protein
MALAWLAGIVVGGIGYGFAAAAQPGPFQTFVISQALTNGWRRTLPSALAPLISDWPIVVLMVLILTRVPGWAMGLLHIASGVFILYLAWGAFTAWRRFNEAAITQTVSGDRSVLKAATMNLISPGPYLFWGLVAGPLLVQAWSRSPAGGLAFLVGFYGAMIATLGGIIFLFGAASQIGPRVNRALLGVSAFALAGFGIYQLWKGFSSWPLQG